MIPLLLEILKGDTDVTFYSTGGGREGKESNFAILALRPT